MVSSIPCQVEYRSSHLRRQVPMLNTLSKYSTLSMGTCLRRYDAFGLCLVQQHWLAHQ